MRRGSGIISKHRKAEFFVVIATQAHNSQNQNRQDWKNEVDSDSSLYGIVAHLPLTAIATVLIF